MPLILFFSLINAAAVTTKMLRIHFYISANVSINLLEISWCHFEVILPAPKTSISWARVGWLWLQLKSGSAEQPKSVHHTLCRARKVEQNNNKIICIEKKWALIKAWTQISDSYVISLHIWRRLWIQSNHLMEKKMELGLLNHLYPFTQR